MLLEGRPIEDEPPHRIVAAGVALVPEGRRLFGDMTVLENLRLGAYAERARAGEAASSSASWRCSRAWPSGATSSRRP